MAAIATEPCLELSEEGDKHSTSFGKHFITEIELTHVEGASQSIDLKLTHRESLSLFTAILSQPQLIESGLDPRMTLKEQCNLIRSALEGKDDSLTVSFGFCPDGSSTVLSKQWFDGCSLLLRIDEVIRSRLFSYKLMIRGSGLTPLDKQQAIIAAMSQRIIHLESGMDKLMKRLKKLESIQASQSEVNFANSIQFNRSIGSLGKEWSFQGNADALGVRFSEMVALVAIGVFCCENSTKCTLRIILSGSEIYKETQVFTDPKTCSSIPFILKEPVIMESEREYIVEMIQTGTLNSYHLESPSKLSIFESGIKLTFSNTSFSQNGTSVDRGQLPCFWVCKIVKH